MKILVTGTTGFVGTVLLPRLIEKHGDAAITAFVLPGDPVPDTWQSLGIRVIRGDITDPEAVERAVPGHTHILHLAGFISYWKYHQDLLRAVNVDGVAHLVKASLKNRVQRFVHISSVGAIGFHEDGTPADETVPFNWPSNFYYMVTKYQGQRVVEEAVKQGLPAVILNPASIMGPGDPGPETPHNQLYRRIYTSTLFGSFSGGLAIVDVRDLVTLIIKAMDTGDPGEKYLAVGANISYRHVIRTVGKYAKRRVYPFPLPAPLFSATGLLLEGISAVTRKQPLLTMAYGRLSGWETYYDGEKSRRVFNHEYIDFEETIRDSCEYFEERFIGKK